jgi:hypothetical protein
MLLQLYDVLVFLPLRAEEALRGRGAAAEPRTADSAEIEAPK